jgi:hypothetical protein
MRIHPRTRELHEAQSKLAAALSGVLTAHDLSYPELIVILSSELSSWASYQLRSEREAEPDNIRSLIEEFEAAARADEMSGMKPKEEWDSIEADFIAARQSLYEALGIDPSSETPES